MDIEDDVTIRAGSNKKMKKYTTRCDLQLSIPAHHTPEVILIQKLKEFLSCAQRKFDDQLSILP